MQHRSYTSSTLISSSFTAFTSTLVMQKYIGKQEEMLFAKQSNCSIINYHYPQYS